MKAAVGVSTLAAHKNPGTGYKLTSAAAARKIVRRGELGAIHFCRMADLGLRDAASYILERAHCVIEIEPDAEGVAFLGRRGTLVMSGSEWRVYSQQS